MNWSKRIGANDEEGKGGQIRATLLSNRATTLLKVNSKAVFIREKPFKFQPFSLSDTKRLWLTRMPL